MTVMMQTSIYERSPVWGRRCWFSFEVKEDNDVLTCKVVADYYESQYFNVVSLDNALTLMQEHLGKWRMVRDKITVDHAWSGDGNRCPDTGYDGPICLRCGVADLPGTEQECKP